MSPEQGKGDDKVPVVWGEAGRSGTAQPGGGSAGSYQCACQCLVGGHKVRSRLVLALSSARQWAQTEVQEIQCKDRKIHLLLM